MADPLSVLSIVEGSLGLIIQCGSVLRNLSEIAGKFKQARLTLMSMTEEIETIKLAWQKIREWSEASSKNLEDATAQSVHDHSIMERLNRSLDCCALVMTALENDLSVYMTKARINNFRLRSKFVWNEKALQDHQQRIRGQVSAMNLLLQVLQLPGFEKQLQALRDCQSEFQNSDDSAFSIVPSGMSSRFSVSAHTEESTELIYRRLSFEDDLFTTRVYKRNYRTSVICSLFRSQAIEGVNSNNAEENHPILASDAYIKAWIDGLQFGQSINYVDDDNASENDPAQPDAIPEVKSQQGLQSKSSASIPAKDSAIKIVPNKERGLPMSIPIQQLGLSSSEIRILREHMHVVASSGKTPPSKLGGKRTESERLLLDPVSLSMLSAHFERLMNAMSMKIEKMSEQVAESSLVSNFPPSHYIIVGILILLCDRKQRQLSRQTGR